MDNKYFRMAVDLFNQGRKSAVLDPALRYWVSIAGDF
jgi:hypothetical protein